MWPSLKTIAQPDTLAEAYRLTDPPQSVLFSGGSYLAADRSPQIHTLIDISRLLGGEIIHSKTQLRIAAGATLEELVHQLDHDPLSTLVQSARWSCPSKNIRNQRTLGGEIGQARIDSELLTMLHCLNAAVELQSNGHSKVDLRDWDHDGIVTSVQIETADLKQSVMHRFALLPSAPAFVIVAGARRDQAIHVAVGGRAKRIMDFTMPPAEATVGSISEIASVAAEQFSTDHYGTATYKQRLIEIGISRAVRGL